MIGTVHDANKVKTNLIKHETIYNYYPINMEVVMRESVRIRNEYFNFKFRVAGVIINDNKLLIVNTDNDFSFYLPGGYVELGETTIDALKRELKEELLLDFEIKEYLGVLENFFEVEKRGKYHEISFYYLVNVPEELNKEDFSLTENDKGRIINQNFKWISLDKLNEIDFRPKKLIDIIKKDDKVFGHLIYSGKEEQ